MLICLQCVFVGCEFHAFEHFSISTCANSCCSASTPAPSNAKNFPIEPSKKDPGASSPLPSISPRGTKNKKSKEEQEQLPETKKRRNAKSSSMVDLQHNESSKGGAPASSNLSAQKRHCEKHFLCMPKKRGEEEGEGGIPVGRGGVNSYRLLSLCLYIE